MTEPNIQDDLRDLVEALGLKHGALMPYTPHIVMRTAIETVRIRAGEPCQHSCPDRWRAESDGSHIRCLACGESLAHGWMETRGS